MSEVGARAIDRREFLRRCGRWGSLGAIGVAVGRSRRGLPPDAERHRCIGRSVCCACPKFDACILPSAASAKAAGVRRSDGG